jgi:hypothetical protein
LKEYINIPKTFPATAGTPARTGKPSTVGQQHKDASKSREHKQQERQNQGHEQQNDVGKSRCGRRSWDVAGIQPQLEQGRQQQQGRQQH